MRQRDHELHAPVLGMPDAQFGNLLSSYDGPTSTLLTMIEIKPADPAFGSPTKPTGHVYAARQPSVFAAGIGAAISAKEGS